MSDGRLIPAESMWQNQGLLQIDRRIEIFLYFASDFMQEVSLPLGNTTES